ncbi:uncharacterized protein LOC106155675 [Lingula anatina]|uniref:Uncharacterized protein LOC106155675 n=1 Tax=Lingula anatina TaxID=7574 RepID=A0A1S3HIX2_LINAN|nr:uncharacterized protein LOC106155675 [Lingula anatina]|eukprot:XP_013386063.1 uncharacterized protein LOC106155675 [Lingula anatina]
MANSIVPDNVSRECQNVQGAYINFQPVSLSFTFSFNFKITGIPDKPLRIQEYHFGVTSASVTLGTARLAPASFVYHGTTNVTADMCTHNFSRSSPYSDLVSCKHTLSSFSLPPLHNGERFCAQFEAKGGGYFVPFDALNNKALSTRIYYNDTTASHVVCMKFDSVAPLHCSANETCIWAPLHVPQRITRNGRLSLSFEGWSDPSTSVQDQASGIEHYEIHVHKVADGGNDMLMVKHESTLKYVTTNTTIDIELPDQPELYALLLTVKDIAGNVNQARRFVLYDNSSRVEVNEHKPFTLSSANSGAKYLWQGNHIPIQLKWEDHFHNTHHFHHNQLRPIRNNTNNSVAYDQITGDLPITGSVNIHGIVNFQYSFQRQLPSPTPASAFQNVPNFQDQSLNLSEISPKDGESYTIFIKAIDIMNNTLVDNVTVYIDSSEPEISNMWLVRDGHKQLYVHSGTDLSKMTLQFNAKDPESGLYTVKWKLGTERYSSDIGNGSESVFPYKGEHPDPNCHYCPAVGPCEFCNYTIGLHSLVADKTHIGQHNRKYHFTIEVINNAMLVTTDTLVVHVDESPPMVGTVLDGPSGKDRDFQTDLTIHGHWYGFYDHESDIATYKVAISPQCLSKERLLKSQPGNETKLTTLTSASFLAPQPGHYVFSVIALNNAVEPSEVACSDGIVIDTSPPEIYNVRLPSGRIRNTLVCDGDTIWLLTHNLTKSKLLGRAPECIERCLQGVPVSIFPEKEVKNMTIHNYTELKTMCSEAQNISFEIALPTDAVNLLWEAYDKESQIHGFEVGISSNDGNILNPDIVGFHSTHNHTYFKRSHSGLGDTSRFFLVIKAKNKAGLSNTASLGPIRLHESPPTFVGKPIIGIVDSSVVIIWRINQLLDGEGATIEIAVGTYDEEEAVQHFKTVTGSCSNVTHFCEDLEMSTLQEFEREFGIDFVIFVRVTNAAGLSRVVASSSIQLPTALKPAVGRVYDVEPNNTLEDIDFILSPRTVCAAWQGFDHHKADVHYSVGIGRRQGVIDLMTYHDIPIANKTMFCVNTTSLPNGTKLLFTVNGSTPAGTVSASSDGFIIINPKEYKPLMVFDGTRCRKPRFISEVSLIIAAGKSKELHDLVTIHVGSHYTVWLNVSIHQSDIPHLIFPSSSDYSFEKTDIWPSTGFGQIIAVTIFPMARNISFVIRNDGNKTVYIHDYAISHCAVDLVFQTSLNALSGHWYFHEGISKPLFHFECAVGQAECTDDEKDCDALSFVTPFVITGLQSEYKFSNLDLQVGRRYFFVVRRCFHAICLSESRSDGVIISHRSPLVGLLSVNASSQRTSSNSLEMDINIKWERFILFGSNYVVSHYRWTVSAYTDHVPADCKWFVKMSNASSVEDRQVLELGLPNRHQLYVLLQGYTKNGLSSTITAPFKLPTAINVPSVLELRQKDIKKYGSTLRAANVGPVLQEILNLDVDFISHPSDLGAVLVGSQHSKVSWFVTRHPKIPDDCATDPMCHHSTTTNGNILSLVNVELYEGYKHFVCTMAKEEVIVREKHFAETLPEIRLCSNGFYIDRTPPSAGHVSVLNSMNGHLLDSTTVALSWQGFVDQDELGNTVNGGIRSFSYAIGTTPYAQDVVRYTEVQTSTHVIVNNISLVNGMVHYFTIKGTDYVGLSSFATSKGIMVDATPPDCGTVLVGSPHRHFALTGSSSLQVHWNGIKDDESGVSRTELAIGSGPHQQDIMALTSYHSTTAFLEDLPLLDGHTYYVQVQVTNGANVHKTCHAPPFLYDSTPPAAGFVRDGLREDIDYQDRLDSVSVNWGGFIDPHSGVQSYKLAVHEEDQDPAFANIGNRTEVRMQNHLKPGVKYIATVEACNNVGLCSRATSDGVIADATAPIAGIVKTGFEGSHAHYVAEKSSVSVRWFGFHDAESGIKRYSWCLGTEPYICDIKNMTNVYSSSSVIGTGLQLPEATRLYATVLAENSAGLTVNQSSQFVIIDVTPPKVVISPTIDLQDIQVSRRNDTQFDPSQLRCTWKFTDDNSPVISHLVKINTHHDGAVPIPPVELGDVDFVQLNLPRNQTLSDGDTYTVSVTACNAAGLCTSSTSEPVLVDSSPPHIGGFKEPLIWTIVDGVSSVNLSWTGFADPHSGISNYYVAVGTSYSDSNVTGGAVQTKHEIGDLQTININTTVGIIPGQLLFLALWAENGAGLRSHIGRITVKVVSGNSARTSGILDIEKHSCDIHYCNSDCTCAVVGRKCMSAGALPNCTAGKGNTAKNKIVVADGILSDAAFTCSSKCLWGHWFGPKANGGSIQRYEWSIGFYNSTGGDGIFDLTTEQPWFDIGHLNYFSYCLPGGRFLNHKQKYAVYLRSWTDFSTFTEYMSNGVMVDLTPPSQRRGKHVIDCGDRCDVDIEFSRNMHTLSADWTDVFTDTQSQIDHYELHIGTFPEGDDVHGTIDLGLSTNFTSPDLELVEGVRYYTTIVAFNKVGLSSSSTSDGVTIDNHKPITGKVYNTAFFHNKPSQQSAETIGVSWTGFDDYHSGISHYEVTIGSSPGLADIHRITDVGLNNAIKLQGLNLTHASNVWASVRGVDAAGLVSEWVHSERLFIDITPPTDNICYSFKQVTLQVPSSNHSRREVYKFNNDESILSIIPLNIPKTLFYNAGMLGVTLHPDDTQTALTLSCEGIQESFVCKELPNKISCSVSIYNSMKSSAPYVCQLERYGQPIRIQAATAVICSRSSGTHSSGPVLRQVGQSSIEITHGINDPDSGIKRHMVGLGTTKGGFQLQPLIDIGKATSAVFDVSAVHGTPIYATVISENNAVSTAAFFSEVLILDWTPPIIHSVYVSVLETENKTSDYQVWAEWEAFDNETTVTGCTWTMGRSTSAQDLIPWQPTTNTSRTGPVSVTLHQGEDVHVTIRCSNKVDLVTVANAKLVNIVTKPPISENASVFSMLTNDRPFHAFKPYQSINSSIHVSWSGFLDIVGIHRYVVRVLGPENQTVVNWTDSGLRTDVCFDGLSLKDGPYSVEVMAENSAGKVSEPKNTAVFILATTPLFKGIKPTIACQKDECTVNWRQTFDGFPNTLPLRFEVCFGSKEGSCDTLPPTETFEMTLNIPRVPDMLKIYGSMTAISPSGTYTTVQVTP